MTSSKLPKASSDEALKAFHSGYNCAQSVVKVFADALSYDENELVSNVAGLGGGRFHGICGAVAGAYKVLEMFCSIGKEEESELCLETLMESFRRQFQQLHNTDQCKTLLSGETKHPKNDVLSICERCIVDAVEVVNEMVAKF